MAHIALLLAIANAILNLNFAPKRTCDYIILSRGVPGEISPQLTEIPSQNDTSHDVPSNSTNTSTKQMSSTITNRSSPRRPSPPSISIEPVAHTTSTSSSSPSSHLKGRARSGSLVKVEEIKESVDDVLDQSMYANVNQEWVNRKGASPLRSVHRSTSSVLNFNDD